MSGGTTPRYALPWPGYDDPADVPADVQRLASATDSAIGGVDTKTGNNATAITGLQSDVAALKALGPGTLRYDGPVLGSGLLAVQAGWALDTSDAQRNYGYRFYINPALVLVVMGIAVQRTGATLTGDARGNITDTPMATIAAPYRMLQTWATLPASVQWLMVSLSFNSSNGYLYLANVSSPHAYIQAGDIITGIFSFVRPA